MSSSGGTAIERAQMARVLEAAGYSTAWVLTDTDDSEQIAIVLRSDAERIHARPVEMKLMAVFPHQKIVIAAKRSGLPLAKLF